MSTECPQKWQRSGAGCCYLGVRPATACLPFSQEGEMAVNIRMAGSSVNGCPSIGLAPFGNEVIYWFHPLMIPRVQNPDDPRERCGLSFRDFQSARCLFLDTSFDHQNRWSFGGNRHPASHSLRGNGFQFFSPCWSGWCSIQAFSLFLPLNTGTVELEVVLALRQTRWKSSPSGCLCLARQADSISMQGLERFSMDLGANDTFMCVGVPPILRMEGRLRWLKGPAGWNVQLATYR